MSPLQGRRRLDCTKMPSSRKEDGILLKGKMLLLLQQFGKIGQRNYVDVWKGCPAEYIVVAVVSDHITRTSRDGTVNELVVVRVGLNHLKMIVGGN